MGLTSARVRDVAEKAADRRGIRILRDGSFQYFPGVKRASELSAGDIERFLLRYYSRVELGLLLSALDQERKMMAEVTTFQHRTDSDAVAMYGGVPAKLDMALQHDFPDEFGMVANKKSVRNMCALLERTVPALLVRRYGAKQGA